MANVKTLIFHHMGMLERSPNGGLHYSGGLVSEKRVSAKKCNLNLIKALFIDLGYNCYNEVHWLEPRFDLARGLSMIRTDDDVVNMCEATLMNGRKIHLYFEHPVIANPDVIEPVDVSNDTEVEYGGADDVDVKQEHKNLEEQEVGDENHENLVAAIEVQSSPRQTSLAQAHKDPIREVNNAAAAKGDIAEEGAGGYEKKGQG
ncbi:hypothetical protein PIB30_088106 [Stylosanthes scabra]|uniref:PB1-like domain-containing protein n=1 Tax=Stylosanthes scabra TaxID=79078 RepID=A0ABU6STX3_9FABA|nr:hypothetical protein [Stylosanthes scabra]